MSQLTRIQLRVSYVRLELPDNLQFNGEHRMNAMAVPSLDRTLLLELLSKNGGECSFDEALKAIIQGLRMTESDARDAVWRLLSQGYVEFTPDRRLRLPAQVKLERAAG